jgi:Coenzyme PQQ synthesis protein D (PqqD)
MQVQRTNSDALLVNKLPDGSTVIVDTANETVYALNATAGAAWDACSDQTTLAGITGKMQQSFDAAISEELAEEAILQLNDKKLVKTSTVVAQASRRQFIATMSSVALPLVVALSISDQKAHALQARSVLPRPTPTPSPLPLPPLPLPIPKPHS